MEPDQPACESRLTAVLAAVRAGQPVAPLLAAGVDSLRVTDLLRPLVNAGAAIDSIDGSDDRADAVLSAGTEQWRVVFGCTAAGLFAGLDVYQRPVRFDGVAGGYVIVVNGPSGAGKSTLMRALQSSARFPLVVLDEPEQIGTVQPGYLIWRDTAPSLHRGYLAAAAAMAAAGNHVMLSAGGHSYQEVMQAFVGIPLLTVGLTCELDVLVHRERRTGRWAGIAAASLGVHHGWTFDLRFDTSNSPDVVSLAGEVLAQLSSTDASADASAGQARAALDRAQKVMTLER